jgi:beta-hydroxylase
MIFYYLGLIFFIIYFIEKLIIIYFPESFSRNIFFWDKNAYTGNLKELIILLFIWYHIIPCYKSKMNIIFKIIIIILLFMIPFIMFYPILSIYNLIYLMYFNNEPFIKNINEVFPENIEFEEKYFTKYKNELNKLYYKFANVDCIKKNNPLFRIGKDKEKCWRAIYIKLLDEFKIKNLNKICPNLYKILNKPYISNAMLSILDENVDIPEHFGYFKGFYRYHLGYIIPKYKNNKPYIICGNKKYEWKEGKGVLFDDMYNHYVRNDTPYKRVVLYLDVIRPELRNDFITKTIIYILSNNYFIKLLDKSQHTNIKIKKNE